MEKSVFLSIMLLVFSCQMTKSTTTKKYKKEPKLSDYWSILRSHPTKGFDNEAYFYGLEQVNTLK